MDDIKLKVNLKVFYILVASWVIMFILQLIPGYTIAPVMNNLFMLITGSLTTIFTAFEKSITGEKKGETNEKASTDSTDTAGN